MLFYSHNQVEHTVAKKLYHSVCFYATFFIFNIIHFSIALSFAVNTDRSVTGYDNVGVAMLNLYNFIKDDTGKSSKGLRAINDVCFHNRLFKLRIIFLIKYQVVIRYSV